MHLHQAWPKYFAHWNPPHPVTWGWERHDSAAPRSSFEKRKLQLRGGKGLDWMESKGGLDSGLWTPSLGPAQNIPLSLEWKSSTGMRRGQA